MVSKFLLFPYYLALKTRHFCYDRQILGHKVTRIEGTPTICVGNVTVGGTGKTPHTEMIIRTLEQREDWGGKSISVLSRGYRRKTKGYLEVQADGSAALFGDEPLQIKKKFPEVHVAVDENRVEGCRKLIDSIHPDLIILDDAFQHRKIQAGLNIVLVNSHRPVDEDELLPVGRLRDLPGRLSKADIIVVTKCDPEMTEKEFEGWKSRLNLRDGQQVFFTKLGYGDLEPVFPEGNPRYVYSDKAILFSGIADDSQLYDELWRNHRVVGRFAFGDHHNFSKSDMRTLRKAATRETESTAVLVTTEKDAQRLLTCKHVPQDLKARIFKKPITVEFFNEEERRRFSDALVEGMR